MMIKNRLICGTALMMLLLLTSLKPAERTLIIEISDIRSDKGYVLVSLYDKDENFPKDPKSAPGKARTKVTNGKATVTFTDLPAGTYAVAVMHDENDNKKMDFNFLGMPKEGFGFSNDASDLFGPPSFEEAAFDWNGDKTLWIRMKYL